MSSQRQTSKCTLETGALINQGTSEAITNNDAYTPSNQLTWSFPGAFVFLSSLSNFIVSTLE